MLRSYYFLNERRVPIVFGPGRHPTSGARFLYFRGPDGMIFEYSVGVDEIEDEATHRPPVRLRADELLHVGLQTRRHGLDEQINAIRRTVGSD